jgi:hypothetical protein
MQKRFQPIDYEQVQQEMPARFSWIVFLKLLAALISVPIILSLLWLLLLICYWFKYGKWPGWGASLGG